MRVLIVDDEPNTVTALRFLLEQAGHRVAVARTAEQAAAEFDAFAPDVMLLDLLLAGAPVAPLIRHVRSHTLGGAVVLILLTVKGREAAVAKALAAGADACILKPFSAQEVLAAVQRCAKSVV